MAVVFFSYSHKDETVRDELEIHLSLLKRQGIIEAWHDRRIGAGNEFAGAISEHLDQADIILLLVSPYFLASDYCYDVEMARAMQRHEAGEARVIPVIVDPCDWHSAPFGILLALPTDGKPISKFPNRHDAFLEVVKAIRQALTSAPGRTAPARPAPVATVPASLTPRPEIRSSNLRVKKIFTDHDKDAFLGETYEYVANYFEGSLDELHKRNPDITSRFKRVDANRFSASVYRAGASISECMVTLRGFLGSSITYSCDAKSTGSYNEALSIGNDGHTLFLKSAGFSMSNNSKEQLTPHGAAELFWTILMRPLQQ